MTGDREHGCTFVDSGLGGPTRQCGTYPFPFPSKNEVPLAARSTLTEKNANVPCL